MVDARHEDDRFAPVEGIGRERSPGTGVSPAPITRHAQWS
ncbi:hypothetical protein Svir_08550 [Saccharomonospora viridis DSM 43017]|uniref:Uncharacterized protein n=1 Tax=Saccharomonospora viridis (strain ATCC 15386 / DSM 43017 / JCM 3036 / CCUG 5913 / NBRC 12207 / NCIMB 9602 / P101) TaxID=471857 RepID=C7MXA6_SACVD|nr:hypothetical protein Svir_08550 [Saccharomonospora viridis DSM 43017]